MSSRSSRRSCSNTAQLNRCTIPLWDKKRLAKELQERGLETTGTQPDLAERLLAFLDGEITAAPAAEAVSPKVATPAAKKKTPVKKTPKSAKKPSKGKKAPKGKAVKQEEVEEAEDVEEEVETEEPAPEEPAEANGSNVQPEEPEEPVETPAPNRRSSRRLNQEKPTPPVKKKEPKKKAVVKVEIVEPEEPEKPEVQEAPEDVPSTSESVPAVTTPIGEEKRSRRKSARLLASEQMEVEQEPTPEPELETETQPEPEPETAQVDEKIGRKRIKAEIDEDPDGEPEASVKQKDRKLDFEENNGKREPSSSPSDPDFDVTELVKPQPKERSDSLSDFKKEKSDKLKKMRPQASSMSSPAPPKPPKQADWQLKWAEKMAQVKKASVAEKKEAEVKRKESSEKPEAPKKKKADALGAIDAITALMSSSIPKKEKVVEKKLPTEPARVSGGSDATSDHQRTVPQQAYPIGTFFNVPAQPKPVHALPPPPPPPPVAPAIPLPVAAAPRRRSRFDQPPVNFAPSFYAKANAPPPTLATTIQISRRSPIPPPPPPRRIDEVPPPPPPRPKPVPAVSAATTALQRRVQELFSGEPSTPVPVVFTPPSVKRDEIPPPPPPRPKPVEKRPLAKEEPVEEADEDDDDDFVIRDTVADIREPVEPAAKLAKIDLPPPPPPPPLKVEQYVEPEAPKAINRVEELKKKEAIAEERRRRAMELGDDGEYDPMDATDNDEVTKVYDYQPTNTVETVEDEDDGYDEEEAVGEEEEEDEPTGDEGPEDPEEEDVEDVEEEDDGPIVINQNPLDLLKLALPVLQSAPTTDGKKDEYAQLDNDIPMESLLKRQEEEKPEEVYYHGEPVPEQDDNELFEIAAGMKPKKKEKKALVQIPEEERLPADVETIELDYYNADIHVKSAEKNIWQIEPFCQDGLALMWGGVRSNFGIKMPFKKTEKDKSTRLGFQIQIDAYQSIQHLPTEFMSDGGDARIGFSLGSSPLVLGEYTGSWCISATGKRATNNHFNDFGHSFGIGDVVTCILDLEECSISYQINGEDVGKPYEKVPIRTGDLIFPTICTKNSNINVNLGQELSDEKWKINEDRDWMFITEMDRTHLVRSHTAPEAKKDCTVLMTIGLPGVGKTTWVRRYLAEHPHEHWTLISADVVMDAMKVNGVTRIRLPNLKRPDFLRGIIGKSMNRLIILAPRRRKNYILDMTNCFADKRKRKLMAFEEFNRKCMVFVPDEDTHQKRLIKQEHEENEKLDTDAIMQHKAAMSLPSIENGDPCEEVIYIDPPAPHEQLAFDRVSKMNYECRSWLVVPGRRRGGYHGNRGYHNDHHGGNYHNNQYNRSSNSGPPSSNQFSTHSPRSMNITHTTFPSGSAPVRDEPKEVPEPIVLPPVKISIGKPASGLSSPAVVQQKVEVSQPLTLNTTMSRKSFDIPGPSSNLSSAGRSSSFSTNSPAIRMPMTPTTSVPPPNLITITSQPPPAIVMPQMFPIDVTVPPPNFAAPPPPLPGAVPPHLLMFHQQPITSVPPPVLQQTTQPMPSQFTFPPPQFAPR